MTRAAAQSTNQQIVHRVHRNFDKAGVLRSETTETIDTRAHNVLLFEQVIPYAYLVLFDSADQH